MWHAATTARVEKLGRRLETASPRGFSCKLCSGGGLLTTKKLEIAPGCEVRGVFGAAVGQVLDVADNAFRVETPGKSSYWITMDAVLKAGASVVVLQCAAPFASSYRVRGTENSMALQ